MTVTWYTTDTAEQRTRLRGAWSDAPIENLEVLDLLLGTAQEQVIAYGPALAPLRTEGGYLIGGGIPARYVHAQLMQAKNLWNAGRATENGDIGDGGFVFTPRPMDKTIKGIIRPEDGRPDVG